MPHPPRVVVYESTATHEVDRRWLAVLWADGVAQRVAGGQSEAIARARLDAMLGALTAVELPVPEGLAPPGADDLV